MMNKQVFQFGFKCVAAVYISGLMFFTVFSGHFFRDLLINFLPYIVLLHIPLLFLLLLFKAKKSSWFILSIMLIQSIFVTLPYIPSSRTFAAEKDKNSSFKILFSNVLKSNIQHDRFLDLIKIENPFAFGVVELTPKLSYKLDALRSDYPFSATLPMNGGFGIGFFSKAPLEHHKVDLFSGNIPYIETTIQLHEKSLKIFVVHPLPPVRKDLFEHRNAALIKLEKLIDPEERTLVMGDFNLTPWSRYYKNFLRATQLQSARSLFKGFQMSWNAYGIPLPIDHFFHSKDISITDFEIGPDIGSDHQPLIAELVL